MADDNRADDVGRKGSVRRAREKARQQMEEEHEMVGRSLSGNGRRPPPVATGSQQSHGAKRSVVQDPAAMTRPRRNTNPYAKEMAEAQAQAQAALQRAARQPSAVDTFLNDSRGRRYPPSNPYHGTTSGTSSPQQPSYSHGSDYNTTALPVPSNDHSHHGQLLAHPAPARRSNTNPSQGSRRDPQANFYPMGSSVSPIPEEFPSPVQRNVKSFASSKVIPSSWGSAPFETVDLKYEEMPETGHGTDGGSSAYNEDEMAQALKAKSALRTRMKGNLEPPAGSRPTSSLARQISLGKTGTGELRTINITRNDPPSMHNRTMSERSIGVPSEAGSVTSSGTIGIAINPSLRANIPDHHIPPSFHNPSGQLRPSRLRANSHSSVESIDDQEEPEGDEVPIIHKQSTNDSEFRDVELGGSRSLGRRVSQFSDLAPPGLNLEAKEKEVRSSLTSLPDLIRRATKLASNLDRGKTASKAPAGVFEMKSANPESKNKDRVYSGSIADMLDSFPPPGVQTPGPNSGHPGDDSKGKSNEVDVPQTRRRFCGLPAPALIVFCIGLVLLFAGIITIPLAVAGKPRNHSPTPETSCELQAPCKNGGMSIGTPGTCSCVCPEGYRGSTCGVLTDRDCVIADLKDNRKLRHDAIVGSAIPRLLQNSLESFEIPLDVAKIIHLFETENVACTTENALVTFNGRNQKRGLPMPKDPAKDAMTLEYVLPARRRAVKANVAGRAPQGLIPTTTATIHTTPTRRPTRTPSPTTTGTSSPTGTATTTRSSSRSTSPPTSTRTSTSTTSTPTSPPTTVNPSQNMLDFARIAILYIFEKTELFSAADAAHNAIQDALRRPVGSENGILAFKPVQLEYGTDTFILSFDTLSITFFERGAQGVVVGGKNANHD
ncbi:hypothetical protein MGYG_05559 [Nannizzia gypsea CBS 118893]|uniref:EGF-like domain-containing protein n=1 Tax=Arthroderma gypseum (strain ATCC MYA-4604 / CBS 118893) TaxID=535722 RepID=E4UWM0_ARTGP|nr:hypothetical protein MGYG_05559 [Nannizzia gypsea CBS 118893]EFR02563.1 hypothetical protein MGYG_05559 [Nannizzia gypsea CBS 118893]